MAESFPEVLGALSDEDEEMAWLVELIRRKEKREEIQKAPEYTADARAEARPTHELVELESFIQPGRDHVDKAPILKLPYDVLSDIALIFSRVQENGAWPFSSVCRAWRAAVLSTPRAWTNIHLRAKHICEYHDDTRYTNKHRNCTPRTPYPALCIKRAGILPFHLELHELPTSTTKLDEFVVLIMPRVQHLCIRRSAGSEVRIAQPAPKLKELLIMQSPRFTDISTRNFEASSTFLVDLFGRIPNDWAQTFSHLQVARLHEIDWKLEHLAAFNQLRVLTLSDCKCEAVNHLHELLRTNFKTLEHLHLSVYSTIMSESHVFQPILLPNLRRLSFLVAHVLNLYRNQIGRPSHHAINLFRSLTIPKVTELQVFAPCIEDLDLGTRCPCLQHLFVIVPSDVLELSPYLQNIRSLLTAAPLQSIDLFIARRRKDHSYSMAMALGPFLRDPIVLGHPLLKEFTLKSNLDFEPLREGVRGEWRRAHKWLHICSATNQEQRDNGFKILEDQRGYSMTPSDLLIDWRSIS